MIRTSDQLIEKIAEDLIWRRKELTDLRAMVQGFGNDSLRSKVLMRCAIALLYAHWEGFVKKSSSYYLEYVASHRLPYSKLAANFVGLALKSKIAVAAESRKMSACNALADFFCFSMDRQSTIPFKEGVDTGSNLSSKVLTDILLALGLDERKFATRLNYIDSKLVDPRNRIAHGEALSISITEYLDLHDSVVGLIETYRNEVENASVLRSFERGILAPAI